MKFLHIIILIRVSSGILFLRRGTTFPCRSEIETANVYMKINGGQSK